MSIIPLWMYLVISVCALGTATISAVAGMGGGIILLTVLILFLPPALVVPIHGLVQMVSNGVRCFFLRKNIRTDFWGYFAIGVPLGALTAVFLLKKIESPQLPQLLICFLIFYVVFKPKKMPALVLPKWGFIILGYVASLLSLLIGATGPLLAPFFLRPDFKKEEIISTKASFQLLIHVLKIPAFLYLGFPYLDYMGFSLTLIFATILGTRLGIFFLHRIKEQVFIRVFKSILFLVGLRLLYKVIMSF